MRKYDDPVDVRQGRVRGTEGPEEFVWRDRRWRVREVVGHWLETGSWWRAVAPVASGAAAGAAVATDLLEEREVYRVVARVGGPAGGSTGVFDLEFNWTDGGWRLAGCLD